MATVERLTNSSTGGPVHVEVADGKIVRILPIDLEESDGPGWQIEARGRTFAAPRRTTLSPWTVAHKSSASSRRSGGWTSTRRALPAPPAQAAATA